MAKIQLGELQQRILQTRSDLLSIIDTLPPQAQAQPGAFGAYSAADTVAFLALWGEIFHKGLREIQRRKKPNDLLRAWDDRDRLWQQATELAATTPWPALRELAEDALYQTEERLQPFNYDDLNQPKRHRWLRNRPLGPLLAEFSYEYESTLVAALEQFAARAARSADQQNLGAA